MKKFVFTFAVVVGFASFAQAAPEVCQLKVNGQVLWQSTVEDQDGQGFYAAANQYAREIGRCVHAKIDSTPNSGRVYRADGSLSSTDSGQKKGLSNNQADEAKRNAGGGCQTVSCIPLVYNDRPQYEQPVQAPEVYIPPTSSDVVVPAQPE